MTQILRARELFTPCPLANRPDCIYSVAVCMCERAGKKLTANQKADMKADSDEAIRVIATYMPPVESNEPVNALIRSIVEGAIGYYVERPHKLPGGGAAGHVVQSANGTTTVIVDSAAARIEAERWITVATIKLVRNPENPYAALYVHCWLNNPPESRYANWFNLFSQFLDRKMLTTKYQARYDKTLLQIEMWFALLPANITVDQLSHPQARLFHTTIELLLEMYLLANTFPAAPEITTRVFWAAVTKMWHSKAGIDYFSALNEAKEAKPDQKNGPGRR